MPRRMGGPIGRSMSGWGSHTMKGWGDELNCGVSQWMCDGRAGRLGAHTVGG